MQPKIIDGGLSIDDRGRLDYFNTLDFSKIKRFYTVQNHKAGFVRAWHGHKKEAKYAFAVSGSVLIAVRPLDETKDMTVYVLDARSPQILYIPAGFYNGFKTLTDDAKIIFFSTATLEESKDDDIRQPARKWDIWGDQWR